MRIMYTVTFQIKIGSHKLFCTTCMCSAGITNIIVRKPPSRKSFVLRTSLGLRTRRCRAYHFYCCILCLLRCRPRAMRIGQVYTSQIRHKIIIIYCTQTDNLMRMISFLNNATAHVNNDTM
jgi:hypothetical protein